MYAQCCNYLLQVNVTLDEVNAMRLVMDVENWPSMK